MTWARPQLTVHRRRWTVAQMVAQSGAASGNRVQLRPGEGSN